MLLLIQYIFCAVSSNPKWVEFIYEITADFTATTPARDKDFQLATCTTAYLVLKLARLEHFHKDTKGELDATQAGKLVLPNVSRPQLTGDFLDSIQEILQGRLERLKFPTSGLTERSFREKCSNIVETIKTNDDDTFDKHNIFMMSLLSSTANTYKAKSFENLSIHFSEIYERLCNKDRKTNHEKHLNFMKAKLNPKSANSSVTGSKQNRVSYKPPKFPHLPDNFGQGKARYDEILAESEKETKEKGEVSAEEFYSVKKFMSAREKYNSCNSLDIKIGDKKNIKAEKGVVSGEYESRPSPSIEGGVSNP